MFLDNPIIVKALLGPYSRLILLFLYAMIICVIFICNASFNY